ncbi:cysteine-rich DPF motif domain-containing protein 1-like [Lineus longissimus]|uniref:cysteine-rich DPF motif domain-containing protein 1-like n=1 Tax=Lineus longissimus TaxID=88925 RepID=UPI002B4DDEBA
MSEPEKVFLCSLCNFSIKYDFFGNKPPFMKSLIVLEEAYFMKDPFSESTKAVILGAHCSCCQQAVCVSQTCSLFYTKRFCLPCVRKNIEEFPVEIQKEVAKIKESA